MFKGVCVCVTQLTALEMVSDIPLLNSAPSPRVRIFMSLQTSIFDTWFRHPCSLLDGMMFLVIYIVTSFTFCILREWFPLFRQAGIPRVICLLSCCWNWEKKGKKGKIKSQNAFLNKRELIWKRNEGLRCQTEIGSKEALQHYKGATSEPADGILAS